MTTSMKSQMAGGSFKGMSTLVGKNSVIKGLASLSTPAAPTPFGRITSSGIGGGPSQGDLEQFLDLPLLETLNRINAQVGGLQKQLAKVDDQVAAAMMAEEEGHEQQHGGGVFLTDVEVSAGKRRSSLLAAQAKPLVVKSVEEASFPGVGPEPHDLPNRISANEVLKRLMERLEIGKGSAQEAKMWERGLQGKHTHGIMKDMFWWFFAEKFSGEAPRPVDEQDKLFGRMASNFICLLSTVPQQSKDKFFDRYHDVLSQAVYAAFRVAFPNSEAKLDSGFRSEISRLFAYWSTGADIGPPEYVMNNGREVKRQMGSSVLEVIGEMQREQAEIEMMSADSKKKKGGPAQDVDSKRAGAMGTTGARAGHTHNHTHKGGVSSPPARSSGAAGDTQTKGAMGASGQHGSASLPPVPPLRLPPKPDTELRTPRAIWTERTGVGANEAAQAAARSGSQSERARPASTMTGPSPRASFQFPKPPRMESPAPPMTPRTPGGHLKKLKMPAREQSSRVLKGGESPLGETPRGSILKGVLKKQAPQPMARRESPLGVGDGQRPSRRVSLNVHHAQSRDSPTDSNPDTGRKGEEGVQRAKPPGRPYDKEGKRAFDMNSLTPFMAYYMATQVSTVALSRKTYKRIHCDETVKSWDIPRPPPKRRWGDEEEEEEEDTARYPKSPREIGEAAVKRNARIVREYNKKAAQRSQSIGVQHQQRTKLNFENRKELQGITSSQDLSNAFSNMLVSSGGGLNFDAIWKKQGTEIIAKFGKER